MATVELPIQYLNLGGEMMYIIDQRLRAQNISEDKASIVRDEIIAVMLSKRFMAEIFQPQPAYSLLALKSVFAKLAHASIMKLNGSSMDKLFDLMVMGLKHQLNLASIPQEIFFITMNHLEALCKYATTPLAKAESESAKLLFIQTFCKLDVGEWLNIRNSLLRHVQDIHIRVSVFLKTGIQDHFGNLVIPFSGPLPPGVDEPGTIRFFDKNEEMHLMTKFPNEPFTTGCPATQFDRTELGLNVYLDKVEDFSVMKCSSVINASDAESSKHEDMMNTYEDGGQTEELGLLAQLIGSMVKQQTSEKITFNLFPTHEEESNEIPSDSSNEIIIEGRFGENNPELNKIYGELNTDCYSTKEPDILDLLDST